MLQASKKITEKRMKWFGCVMRVNEKDIEKRMLDVDMQEE